MADVEAGVDDRHAAPRAAAGGRERRRGADLVVGPGVRDAAVAGVGCVEGVGGGVEAPVGLDVGDAGIGVRALGRARRRRARCGEHAERVDGLHARAQTAKAAHAQPRDVGVRAGADEQLLRP